MIKCKQAMESPTCGKVCCCLECEERVKEQAGLTSRCMPMEQESLGAECAICGKPAKHMIIWGKAY